jgi:hypothetical protein
MVMVLVREYAVSPELRRATHVIVKPELTDGVTVIVPVPFPAVIVPPDVIDQVNELASQALAVKVTGVVQHCCIAVGPVIVGVQTRLIITFVELKTD